MSTQLYYTFMLKAASHFARDESEAAYSDERVKTYLESRIAGFDELLDSGDEIGLDHLKSAYNLIYNLAGAHDYVRGADDKAKALRQAAVRDLRDELEWAVSRLESINN